MLIGGFALAVIGFFTPPVGQIHESVLGIFGAPDKPCGVGRADANPKLLLNDT